MILLVVVKWVLGTALALGVLALAAGQAGLLSGSPPGDLGVRDGRLKPPAKTPNSVSSQAGLWPGAMSDYASIVPLSPPRALGGSAATMARLKAIAEGLPGARVVEARPDYLYVQFTTRLLKFVDDTEFWFDAGTQTVQVRAASRVGRKDFGVNRARIEAVREQLARP